MQEYLPREKRALIGASIGLLIFAMLALLMWLMRWTSSILDPMLISYLLIAFLSSAITGFLWRSDWKPDGASWTFSNILFWGNTGLIVGLGSITEVGQGMIVFPLIGGIAGCIFGVMLGIASYSKVVEWENTRNTNVIIGWITGVLSGFVINIFVCFTISASNIYGPFIGGLSGLLTGLAISKFSQMGVSAA